MQTVDNYIKSIKSLTLMVNAVEKGRLISHFSNEQVYIYYNLQCSNGLRIYLDTYTYVPIIVK